MAIIIEEERSKANIVRLVGWLGILAMIGAAVYYIFFASPDLVIVPPPASLTNIEPLGTIVFHPEDVLNNALFLSLKVPQFPMPTPQGPALVGRSNPFIAP